MSGADEIVLTGLRFLRPAWLIGLPAIALLALWWWRRGARIGAGSGWEAIVDPALRPYVLEGEGSAVRRPRAPYALFAAWALACAVLSGPVFERRSVQVHDAPRVEIVLLDLSISMRGDDLAPDRITRARYRLDELLERADGMEIGLIGFAEVPYTVAPPTDDMATLSAFLPSLVPEIVPVPGSRPDRAIRLGVELLDRRGASGHLLLVTDAVPDEAAFEAARTARELGHTLSVLGVGTAEATPLRGVDGRFVTAADGSIVVPRLDADALFRLASAGGGAGTVLADDGADVETIQAVRASLAASAAGDGERGPGGDDRGPRTALWWIERSPWAVPVLALAALLPFRRGRDG